MCQIRPHHPIRRCLQNDSPSTGLMEQLISIPLLIAYQLPGTTAALPLHRCPTSSTLISSFIDSIVPKSEHMLIFVTNFDSPQILHMTGLGTSHLFNHLELSTQQGTLSPKQTMSDSQISISWTKTFSEICPKSDVLLLFACFALAPSFLHMLRLHRFPQDLV